MPDLLQQFGDIDIYLFDQLLKGRIPKGARILDAGCGEGRNLVYFLRAGYDVSAIDLDGGAIDFVRTMAAQIAPALPAHNFQVAAIEQLSADKQFDLVISNAVLHFAADDGQFHAMISAMWRAVKPGGILFCRLASSIGLERQIELIKGRRFLLPDGSERYLVDYEQLDRLTAAMDAELLDPIKTTLVQNQRSMTTWVLRRPVSRGLSM